MRTIREVMEMPVTALDFSVRSTNCMKNMNVRMLCELTRCSQDEIAKRRNVGRKSIAEITEKLHDMGLSFSMTDRMWMDWGLAHLDLVKSL
jgi:DNA-directed RNA polymerase subunit alpha